MVNNKNFFYPICIIMYHVNLMTEFKNIIKIVLTRGLPITL